MIQTSFDIYAYPSQQTAYLIKRARETSKMQLSYYHINFRYSKDYMHADFSAIELHTAILKILFLRPVLSQKQIHCSGLRGELHALHICFFIGLTEKSGKLTIRPRNT